MKVIIKVGDEIKMTKLRNLMHLKIQQSTRGGVFIKIRKKIFEKTQIQKKNVWIWIEWKEKKKMK